MTERHWMATSKLRALARAGRTLDEIAQLNAEETGWTPDRSTVSNRLRSMGEKPRHVTRSELVPWKVESKHRRSRFYFMLQAERRRRNGRRLSKTDQKYVDALNSLLFGRVPLVVGYHAEIGFYLVDRADSDQDIIRMPPKSLPNGA